MIPLLEAGGGTLPLHAARTVKVVSQRLADVCRLARVRVGAGPGDVAQTGRSVRLGRRSGSAAPHAGSVALPLSQEVVQRTGGFDQRGSSLSRSPPSLGRFSSAGP